MRCEPPPHHIWCLQPEIPERGAALIARARSLSPDLQSHGDLSGQGAARDGQRWNQPGQLEVLVHLNGVLSVPLVLSGYDVPDGPGLISEADPADSAAFGGSWLRAGQQLGLVLPSVVVPQARNLQLNPLHRAIAQVALAHQEPFRLDQRLA